VADTSPAKISVECPHCGFMQVEYAAAKSSICRQCGRYFSPFAPKTALKLRAKEEPPTAATPENSSIFHRFEGFWKRRRSSVIECFECKRKQEVCGAATSTICPGCSAHIDLRDYKITSGFSRTIRTRGDVHLTAKGGLSSSSVICRSALIEGRLRSNLHCDDTATINFSGKIPGRLSGRHVIVSRKADIHCFRRVRVGSIEIKGKMSGDIIAQTMVTVHKKGSLEGNVTARAISVEKGGMFSGELVIGQADLTQGELLPGREPTATSKPDVDTSETAPQPLPAT
jgi:cytoskeletal protein CcmA (bactofilin family)/ribosomal protein S27E